MKFFKGDILITLALVCIIVMIIIPLPAFVIDIFIATNLTLAVIILLSTMYVKKAIDFSVFPSLLLITAVYRLAIEVATSKKILLGMGGNIKLVGAFGEFVAGGNLVIGGIIFIILTIIQILVVIRGTTRVSEVAARFVLDAMPQKQMSIDADLNAGYITPQEAKERREEIRKEADFYGAMDGASRFIQGDVWAGILIAIINIIGGLMTGILLRGEPLNEALRNYTIYTIGAGLVVQLPAFLIAVSTGMLVSRSAAVEDLSKDLPKQLFTKPNVLFIATCILFLLGLLPGFPKLPLFALSVAVGILGFLSLRTQIHQQREKEQMEKEKRWEEERAPEAILPHILPQPLQIEIGSRLCDMVDPKSYGKELLQKITKLRQRLGLELGFLIPPIKIIDNPELLPNEYRILIRGTEVTKNRLVVDKVLAIKKHPQVADIQEAQETREPIAGTKAFWIEPSRQNEYKNTYTIVEPQMVLLTHLQEIIKQNASCFLTREDVNMLLDNLKKRYPTVVNELLEEPVKMTIGEIQKVLQVLLQEGVSIRDLVTICETLADWVAHNRNINFLVDKVRMALSRQIIKKHQDKEGTLKVITIHPQLSEEIKNSVKKTQDAEVLTLHPQKIQSILSQFANYFLQLKELPVVLCEPSIRRYLKEIISKAFPSLEVSIISFNEIGQVKVESVGMIKP